jgi:hypothetical protein
MENFLEIFYFFAYSPRVKNHVDAPAAYVLLFTRAQAPLMFRRERCINEIS